jgi:hypothetical protein
VDNELSKINLWREVHEEDEAALQSRIQDISSVCAWELQTSCNYHERGSHPPHIVKGEISMDRATYRT